MATSADPDNCPGSGKPWASGGKCPECDTKADILQNVFKAQARRGDSLSPRVPRHPAIGTAARAQAEADSVAPPKAEAEPVTNTKAGSVRTKNKTAPAHTPTRKGQPKEPARPKAKAASVNKDPLTKPFTRTIQEYLVWLKGQIGPFEDVEPERLAGLAISMYSKYQISPERRAARGA